MKEYGFDKIDMGLIQSFFFAGYATSGFACHVCIGKLSVKKKALYMIPEII